MTVEVGQLLTATAAPVTGRPSPTRTWQWLRNGTAISGATASTYTAAEADLDALLSVQQIETNAFGVATAVSATVGPVIPVPPFDPTSLADLVVWADIHPDYCFQNSDGTGACVVGDPVGYVTDRSGNGYHLTQSVAASRPTLQQTAGGKYYLDFDGGGDHLLLPAAATSGTTVLDTVIGLEADSVNTPTLTPMVFGMFDGLTNYLYIARFVSSQLGIASEVGGADQSVLTSSFSTLMTPYVWRSLRNGDSLAASLDGVSQGTATGVGTGGLANRSFALGARGRSTVDLFFDGKVFGLIVVNRAMTSTEIADTEAFMADKAGVTL